MQPFPIYSIPETTEQQMPSAEQWLCIVLGQPLSGPNHELLEKICTALKADLNTHVFIREIDQDSQVSFPASHRFKLIISFGIRPSQLGIWLDLQSAGIKYLEAFTFILTSSLNDLAQSPAAKKQLWSAMLSYLDLNPAK